MGIIQKQSFYSSITLGIGILLGFFTSGYLLPNFFSEEQNGVLTLLNSYSLIYSQVAMMGLSTVIIRFYPHIKDIHQHRPQFLWFITLLGCVGFSFFLVFYYFTKPYFKSIFEASPLFRQYYFLLIPCTFSLLFFYLFDAYSTAIQKPIRGFTLKDVVQRLLILCSIGAYIFYTLPFSEFMWAYSASILLPTLLLALLLIREGHFNLGFDFIKSYRVHFKDMSKVAGYSFLLGLTYVGVTNVDAIMIERYLDLEDAGIYGRNMFFGVLVALPYRILHKSASGLLAALFKKNDLLAIKNIYYKSCLNQLIIGLFLFCMMWINIHNIYQIIPKSYEAGKYVIFFIGLGNLINMAGGVNTAVISFSPYFRWNTYFAMSLLVLIILTNMAFIPLYGITGAAMATAISLSMYNAGMYILLWVKYKFQPFQIKHGLVIIYALLGMFACAAMPIISNYMVDLVVRCVIFASVFGSLILLTRISPDINGFVTFMMKRITFKR